MTSIDSVERSVEGSHLNSTGPDNRDCILLPSQVPQHSRARREVLRVQCGFCEGNVAQKLLGTRK